MVALLFLALLLLSALLRAIPSTLHLRMLPGHFLLLMLSAHLLLMMLRTHLLLMMHLLIHRMLIHRMLIHCMLIHSVLIHRMLIRPMLVHCMLPSVFSHVVGVRFCLVSPNLLLVAVNIFSLLRVPLVVARMFVAMFFASHSCSLGLMSGARVSSFVFSFSCPGCACRSNALCAFPLPVSLIE